MSTVRKEKLIDDLDTITDSGIELLKKNTFEAPDFAKLKVMKAVAPFISAKVSLVQQENVVKRLELVRERMTQLGYNETKTITG